MPCEDPNQAALLAAEENRRRAMLAADAPALDALLSDHLAYVHSTGMRDSKPSWLQKLSSGTLRYEKLEFSALHATLLGRVGLVSATMHATLLRADGRRDVASSYLAVWQRTPSGWQLEAVQATPLPAAP